MGGITMNLEKEIEKYYYDNFAFLSSTHIPTLDILTDIAEYFIGRQKEEMLSNALDATVTEIHGVNGLDVAANLSEKLSKYKDGDNVKLIIVKDEEQ